MSNYFYQDADKKVLKEELLTDKAKSWALTFIRPERGEQRGPRNPNLTGSQLRRFYNDAKALQTQVDASAVPFERIRPLIKMMKSKVAYACPTQGSERKVPMEFRQYIEEMIDHVEDRQDFEAFATCFEAVVGFFYGEGGRK